MVKKKDHFAHEVMIKTKKRFGCTTGWCKIATIVLTTIIAPSAELKCNMQHITDGWQTVKLEDIAEKCTIKNHNFTYSFALTNSAQYGIPPQSEHFNKEIAAKENIDWSLPMVILSIIRVFQLPCRPYT